MYQSLALAQNSGQATYTDSGAFLHAPGAGSPVFVAPTRVPSMLPYLPACEPGSQPPTLAVHSSWTQAAAADSSAFGSGSPHPPAAHPPGAATFPFAHSPPGSGSGGSAGARDSSTFQGSLLAREQYPTPLGRPMGASYPTTYPAYVTPDVAPSWTSGPFDGSIMHGLQGRPSGLPGRRATFGEYRSGAAQRDVVLILTRAVINPLATKCYGVQKAEMHFSAVRDHLPDPTPQESLLKLPRYRNLFGTQ